MLSMLPAAINAIGTNHFNFAVVSQICSKSFKIRRCAMIRFGKDRP